MPEDGHKQSNVALLADAGRRVELVIPVAQLSRIAEWLASADGTVTGTVDLSRRSGRIIADVKFEAQLTLRCQRCLGPLQATFEGGSEVALLAAESEAATVPQEFETALAPDGRMRLADLVEEELLLALPAAPRHADGQCPGASPDSRSREEADVQRPFASLGELLGRSKH
jgi:uncharacterized protein